MGYKKRYNQAISEMKKMALYLYNALKNGSVEWETIKTMAWEKAQEEAHIVYGEDKENCDRYNGWSSYGHEERAELKRKLNDVFHQELKKYPKLI